MKAMRESGDAGRVSNFETVFRDKDGDLIPVMISGSIIHDDEGKEIGSIGFARDIRRMRQREQLATAGEIAVSLAHEINNPLESITNNLELLARAIEGHMKDAELATENEHLDAIRAGIGRVNAIVRRLDEMSRKGIYETRDYMNGKRMADLAPREAVQLPKHFGEHPTGARPLRAELAAGRDGGAGARRRRSKSSPRSPTCCAPSDASCIPRRVRRAALGILRNMKIDAVISDVVMPEMDGYEFYLHVKQEMPQIPVVLMTAYYYDKDHIIKRSKLKGLEGAIFKKPVNPAKLRQMLIQNAPAQRFYQSACRPRTAPRDSRHATFPGSYATFSGVKELSRIDRDAERVAPRVANQPDPRAEGLGEVRALITRSFGPDASTRPPFRISTCEKPGMISST